MADSLGLLSKLSPGLLWARTFAISFMLFVALSLLVFPFWRRATW